MTKKTYKHKLLSIFVTMLMLFNIFATSIPVFAEEVPEIIAAWNFTSAPTDKVIMATDGILKDGATLTNSMGNIPSYTASSKTIWTNGWDNGANVKYWEFSLSTTGYSQIKFTANAYSSSGGPRDFKIIYSTDNGNSWNEVLGSERQLGTSLPPSPVWNAIALPDETANQGHLLLRLIMWTNTQASGTGDVTTTGTSRLAAISITGIAIKNTEVPTEKVADVIAVPGGGPIPSGQMVTLSTPTENATIYYSVYSANTALIENAIYEGPIKLIFDSNATPITLMAYATADGLDNSNVSSWTFTQAKLEKVTASPPSGEVALGTKIELNAADGAAIYYTTDGSDPNTNSTLYTGPITISSSPFTIKAIAVKEGYLNSDIETFIYNVQKEYKLDGDTGTAAEWILSSSSNLTQPIPATGGDFKDVSELSCWFGTTNPTLIFSAGGASTSGWNGGSKNPNYWLVKTSTKGMANLTLSWRMRSSNTGPRDFKVQYSIDNKEWKDIPDATITIKPALSITADDSLFTKVLPNDAANRDVLYIRWIMTSETAANGGTVASGGTHQINNIVITGAYIVGDNQVYPVFTDTVGNAVPLGAVVKFFTQTPDATIMYSVDEGKTYTIAENGNVTLDTLPITLYVKAVKEGMEDSRVKVFTYTQARADNVFVSPAGGEVNPGDIIKLSCSTPNATIYYSWVKNPEEKDFSIYNPNEPLVVPTNLPATLTVYATAPGYIAGPQSSYYFTQMVDPSSYNLYFGQLHSHTNLSDGIGEVEDAFNYARYVAKVDFLAITDHSNMFDNDMNYALTGLKSGDPSTKWIRGHNAADSITEDGKFVGIYGFEMTWSASTGGFGHINTFNTPGFESRNNSYFTTNSPDPSLNGLKRYYDRLTEVPGSISQLNHPGPIFGDFLDFAFYDPKYDPYVTLIEVGNGEGAIGSSGYFPSYEYYTRALDKGWHVAPTNGQDNHQGKWGNANTARTVVLAQNLTRDDIYEALRNRRVYATEDDNLRIRYTVNGHVMGYIYPDGSTPTEPMDFYVNLQDPDGALAGGTVSVIVNGGLVAASTTIKTDSSAGALLIRSQNGDDFTWKFKLQPDYSYYYIQVIEPNGLKAVTAPVWIGTVQKVGIDRTTIDTTLPVKGEAANVTTTFYNNETSNLYINKITYSIDGEIVWEDNNPNVIVAPGATGKYTFSFVPTKLGKYNLDVKVNATFDGKEKVFKDVLKLNVADPDILTTIAVDAGHFNDYVSGNYANYINNFIKVATGNNIRVKLITGPITDEALKDSTGNYVSALVLTPPARKSGTYTPKDGSTPVNYLPSLYSQDELAAISKYAENGGNFIIAGNSSYNDATGTSPYKVSTQMNNVLEAIGATTRMNADEAFDDVNNIRAASDSGNYRLAFPYENHNLDSPFTKGVKETQTYSFYGGCTLKIDSNAIANGLVQTIVSGNPTTYGSNDLTSPPPKPDSSITTPPGEMKALVSEKLPGGGMAIIGGTVYISDFEIPDFDPTNSLKNSNMQIVWNILKAFKKPIPLVSIATARNAEKGKIYMVEGIVTSCTVGYNPNNAFFDTMYIQDETGGLNVFGVSEKKIQVGQKVRLIGTIGEYLGDKEIVLNSEDDVQIIDYNINPLEPKVFSTTDAMKPENGGWLARVTGTVTRVDKDDQGLIQAIYVKDENDQSEYGARLFIDGYIGYSNPNSPKLEDFIKVGIKITGVGLLSTDPNGQRIRVRDRSEIISIETPAPAPEPTPTPGSEPTPTPAPKPTPPPAQDHNDTTLPSGEVSQGKVVVENNVAIMKVNKDKIVADIRDTSKREIQFDLTDIGTTPTKAIEIPYEVLSLIAENSKNITVRAQEVSLKIDPSIVLVSKETEDIIQKAGAIRLVIQNKGRQIPNTLIPVTNEYDITLKARDENVKIQSPVEVTFNIKDAKDIRKIGVYYLNETTNQWEYVGGKVDKGTNTITFEAKHFSTYGVFEYNKEFKDVTKDNWAYDVVNVLASKHIIKGIDENTFLPNAKITRAEFAALMIRALGIEEEPYKGEFNDVKEGAWYANAIEAAYKAGIMLGDGKNIRPDDPITREEMTAVIMRVYGKLAGYKEENIGNTTFSDNNKINEWAKNVVANAVKLGIVRGYEDNTFKPKDNATRAEAAAMLYRILERSGNM